MRFKRNKNRFGAPRRTIASAVRPAGQPHKGVYLLPNLFTTAALFCGFYGIVQAMGQQFTTAAVAIFAAMVLDSLDGRVARMTNTQSAFGAEYDSLADMVSFGAAPALIVYEWALHGMGKLGWVAAFVYVAGAALRLARFNTNAAKVDKAWFQGLPSPAAAALVTGFVWVMDDVKMAGAELDWLAWTITFYAGVTMVSSVPFFSGKDFHFRKSVPFLVLALIPLAFALASQDPPKVLFGVFVLYGLSGYVVYVVRRLKGQGLKGLDIEEDKHF
ncbi:CDP-diacylglycerol--serine O-phosphatidyltransferase [Limnobacter humi]|uniref:CDP-diacylglycerol--serine O-phosphatidyltransferase n=2 Tax=Pseudomonadota TaxID=1224 RepID=A0ABT1WHA1_9BURK|nr:CDP-diacylglycerol--serine O-phosphatidyltransferase [Limnobacter humi]MCQ8896243.1 CDP-diacylglycerol--serine O-phosphatidyltransferase [Limnobacter humi]